jgi:hypothetical protein
MAAICDFIFAAVSGTVETESWGKVADYLAGQRVRDGHASPRDICEYSGIAGWGTGDIAKSIVGLL